MNLRHSFSCAILLLLGLADLALGRTWIVDAAGGPGAHFGDLPPAEAAASDGDTIVLRAGIYTPVATSKALRILGESGAILRNQMGIFPPNYIVFEINAIPAGREFVLAGVSFEWPGGSQDSLRISGCQGRVHLDRVRIPPPGGVTLASSNSAAVNVMNCAQVTLSECRLGGFGSIGLPPYLAALECLSSTVVLNHCDIRGGAGLFIGHGAMGSTPGIGLDRSRLVLSGGAVEGGRDDFIGADPSPAIAAANSTMLLTGDATTRLAAGLRNATSSVPSAAVEATGGSVIYDPAITLVPNSGMPGIGGTATVTAQRWPSLRASGAAPGGTVQTELFSAQGEFVGLYLALPGDRVALGAMGELWLDFGTLVVLAFGQQGVGEHWSNAIPVPPVPGLRGLALTLQASSGALPGIVRFSTPGTVILN